MILRYARLVRQMTNQRTFPTAFNLIQPRNILFTDAFIDLHSVEEAERNLISNPASPATAHVIESQGKTFEISRNKHSNSARSILGPCLLECVFRFVGLV